jgi:hypothetical protein
MRTTNGQSVDTVALVARHNQDYYNTGGLRTQRGWY